jgi:hypothetical protein
LQDIIFKNFHYNGYKGWAKKPIKSRKSKKNNWKNRTEPNPNRTKNRAKPEKNRAKPKNRAEPIWTGFCPKKPNRNQSVWTGFGFFKKIQFDYYFFIKTEPNKKDHPQCLLYVIFWWLVLFCLDVSTSYVPMFFLKINSSFIISFILWIFMILSSLPD